MTVVEVWDEEELVAESGRTTPGRLRSWTRAFLHSPHKPEWLDLFSCVLVFTKRRISQRLTLKLWAFVFAREGVRGLRPKAREVPEMGSAGGQHLAVVSPKSFVVGCASVHAPRRKKHCQLTDLSTTVRHIPA